MSENLDVALRLTASGLAVFPCRLDKRPVPGFKWLEWATNDPHEIKTIWAHYGADSMPAIALGRCGLVVVDLDRKKEVDGVAVFDELLNEYGELPLGPSIKSPSGGFHLYFAQPEGRTLTNREGSLSGKGINIRGIHGYVIAPGAVRGDTGEYYEPLAGYPDLVDALKDGPPPMPAWLADLIEAGKVRPDPDGHHVMPPVGCPSTPTDVSRRHRNWALGALERIANQLASTPAGHRDGCLNSSIVTMAGYAWLGVNESEVREAFWHACTANGYLADPGDGPGKWHEKFKRVWPEGLARPLRGPRDRVIDTSLIQLPA